MHWEFCDEQEKYAASTGAVLQKCTGGNAEPVHVCLSNLLRLARMIHVFTQKEAQHRREHQRVPGLFWQREGPRDGVAG